MSLSSVLIVVLVLSDVDGGNKPVIQLSVILPYQSLFLEPLSFMIGMNKSLPAIDVAIQEVTRRKLLENHELKVVQRDSRCSDAFGPIAAIYVYERTHVFIGPVCNYVVAAVSRYSNLWGVPVITAGGLATAFGDKREYLLTRMVGSYTIVASGVTKILEHFKWRKFGIIYQKKTVKEKSESSTANAGRSECYLTGEAMYVSTVLKKTDKKLFHKGFENTKNTTDVERMLNETRNNARVVVLCASPDSVRDIMLKAHDLNFTKGEYVFINIDLFSKCKIIAAGGRYFTCLIEETSRPWPTKNSCLYVALSSFFFIACQYDGSIRHQT